MIIFLVMPKSEYVPISAEEQNRIDKAEELRIAENKKICEATGLVFVQEGSYSKGSCITRLELVKKYNESVVTRKEIEKDRANSNLK
jgi:hypothetical protein